jgi:hypothetical protein
MTMTIMATAPCGCPIPPDSEGHLGWHLKKNHPEALTYIVQGEDIELVTNILTNIIDSGPRPKGVHPGDDLRQNAATIERLKKIVAEMDEVLVAS